MVSITATYRLDQSATLSHSSPAIASKQAATPVADTPSSPSSHVVLGQPPTGNDPDIYSRHSLFSGRTRYAWESDSQNTLSTTLQTAFESSRTASRFKGIGGALMQQLAFNGGNSISQSLFTYTDNAPLTADELKLQQQNLRNHPDNGVTFNLTTASGATVKLLLASSEKGLAASAEVEGAELTADELKGLGELADSFQSAIDGLYEVPPQLKLSSLVKLDPAVFTSLQMTAKLETPSGEQAFDLALNDKARSLSLEGPSGQVKLSLDTQDAELLGNGAQRKAAIDNYLDQFDAAQSRGHGDRHLVGLLKDAFTALNSMDDNRQPVTQRPLPLTDKDRALLSGLADFKASISENARSSNPMRPDEVDSFSFNLSQTTSIKGRALQNLSVEQHQQSKLQASFHRAIGQQGALNLDNDRKSQNYTYHLIDDQASSSTRLAYDEGILVEASATQQASQKERVLTYIQGDLKDDVTTPKAVTQSRNLLKVLNDTFEQSRNAQNGWKASVLEEALQSERSRWMLQVDPAKIAP